MACLGEDFAVTFLLLVMDVFLAQPPRQTQEERGYDGHLLEDA